MLNFDRNKLFQKFWISKQTFDFCLGPRLRIRRFCLKQSPEKFNCSKTPSPPSPQKTTIETMADKKSKKIKQSPKKRARQSKKIKLPILNIENFHEWQARMIENFKAYR